MDIDARALSVYLSETPLIEEILIEDIDKKANREEEGRKETTDFITRNKSQSSFIMNFEIRPPLFFRNKFLVKGGIDLIH